MLNKYLTMLLSSALLLTVGTSFSQKVNAQTVVNDTFTDGGFTNGNDPLDISWFRISSNYYQATSTPSQINLSVVDDSILGSGKALKLDNPTITTTNNNFYPAHFALGTFPRTTLGSQPGNTIYLRFEFRFTTQPSTSTTYSELPNLRASGLRFGLYNSASTLVTADILAALAGSGTAVEDDGGYGVTVGIGGTSSLQIARENFNAGDTITGGNGGVSLAINSTVPSIDDTTRHTAVLTIRRIDSQTVQITATIDGFFLTTVDSGSEIITSFDEIAIRSVFSDLDINIDNVVVQAN